MTTPAGTISMSQVNTELGRAATQNLNLNDQYPRTLAGRPSGTISLSDLRSKTWPGTVCAFCYEGQGLSLSAPSLRAFRYLVFANYGTPEPCPAQNPNYISIGGVTNGASCGGGVRFEGVNVNGATTIGFSANNDTWGDPCGGVYKQMTVIAYYS